MAFNRYDTISTSTYDPRSLQETLMVPMLKRQQHDEANKQLYTQLGELGKIDPLDVHYNEAQKIKADLTSKINSQAERLATEGFNVNTTGDIYKTNRDVSEQYSPTGKIGKINAAKIDYGKQKEQFLKNAEDQKISRDRALQLWNEKTKDYSGYDAEKNILNITPQGVAAHQDYEDDLMKYHAILGKTTTSARSSGYKIVDSGQGDGSKVMIDKTGNIVHSDNISQLNSAIKGFGSKWLNPNGEGFKYAKDAGLNITPEKVYGDFSAMTEKSDIDNRGQQTQYIAGKEPSEIGSGTIISNDSTLKSDALETSNYGSAIGKIKKLVAKRNLTAVEKAELDDLIELRRNADSKLNQNENYKKLNSDYNKKNVEMQAHLDKYYEKKNDGKYYLKKNSPISAAQKYQDIGSEIARINEKKSDLKNNEWQRSSSLRHNYSYMPSNPKEEAIWNLHNENVYNTLKGIGDLGNVLDLTSINTSDGTKKNLIDSDVKNAKFLLNGADPKTFKISNIKTYGDNRTPEVTVVFNTGKNAKEFDMDRGLFSSGRSSKFGGSEQPVTLTFKLKKFSNSFDTGSAAGYKNLTGAIANFWKDKGGVNKITGNFQGAEVYNSMMENAYSGISNEELYSRAQTDSDAREALLIRVAKHKSKK